MAPLKGLFPSISALYDAGEIERVLGTDQFFLNRFPKQLDYEKLIEPFSNIHELVKRAYEFSAMPNSFTSILLRANDHWQTQFSQILKTDDFASQSTARLLVESSKLSLYDLTRSITLTESIFSRIDFSHFRDSLSWPLIEQKQFESCLSSYLKSYDYLTESIQASDISKLPAFILPNANREVFTSGYVLGKLFKSEKPDEQQEQIESLLLDEAEKDTSDCIKLLSEIGPEFLNAYIGANNALEVKNPEQERHYLISIRTLCDTLLKRFAPDDEVLKWIPKKTKEYITVEGKLTYKARIYYICRNIHNSYHTDSQVENAKTFLVLNKTYNKVHKLGLCMTPDELRAIKIRTDSWLKDILQTWKYVEYFLSENGKIVVNV